MASFSENTSKQERTVELLLTIETTSQKYGCRWLESSGTLLDFVLEWQAGEIFICKPQSGNKEPEKQLTGP